MRISTSQTFIRAVDGLQNASREIARTQEQISTGKKLLSPADDPVAAARILRLDQEAALRDQFRKNIDAVQNSLGLSEAALNQSVDVLQRIRELTIQAGSGVNTQSDRRLIAAEVTQRLGELVGIVNTRSASGEYLFGGNASGSPPFVATAAQSFVYQGDQGQRQVAIGASSKVAITDSGYDIFVNVASAHLTIATQADANNDASGGAVIDAGVVVDAQKFAGFYPDKAVIELQPLSATNPPGPNFTVRRASDNRVIEGLENVPYAGNTSISFAGVTVQVAGNAQPGDRFSVESTSKQPVLATIGKLQQGLLTIGDKPGDQETLSKLIGDTLTNLDNGVSTIIEARSAIGARLNTAQSTASLHDDVELVSAKVRADLRDVDFAEAASRLSQQSLILQAAQQSFAKTASLSLFNFL